MSTHPPAGLQSEQPISNLQAWLLAIRPKTLSAAFAPVMVGTALAYYNEVLDILPALGALAGALLIQIGTNLANDVLDFRRGADTEERMGPTRVVQAGLLSSRAVTIGAGISFLLATLVGMYLIAIGGPPILYIGIASIISGVLYTAGPYPLAYLGLGDLFVMVFFGLFAVSGTYYLQSGEFSTQSLMLGFAVGCLSVGILIVNNLRDRTTDMAAGKMTMAVRLGDARTRRYFGSIMGLGFIVPVIMSMLSWFSRSPDWALGPLALAVIGALHFAQRAIIKVRVGTEGKALNPVLGMTARAQIWHAGLLSLGMVLDRLLKDVMF